MYSLVNSVIPENRNKAVISMILMLLIFISLVLAIFSTVKVLDKNVELDNLRVNPNSKSR